MRTDCDPVIDRSRLQLVQAGPKLKIQPGIFRVRNQQAATDQLERLCRYITRPAVSTKRLSLTRHGKVRYELKTPYSDGTTHIRFEPLDFMYRMYGMPRAQGCA